MAQIDFDTIDEDTVFSLALKLCCVLKENWCNGEEARSALAKASEILDLHSSSVSQQTEPETRKLS